MPISINGTGTITGISAGGLPSGIVTGDTISNGSISTADIADGCITAPKLGYQNFGFRNRIINGDMRIDQRNAGAEITPTNGQYSLDRWTSQVSVASKYKVQQVSDAPSYFGNSLKLTSLSAYSIGASECFGIMQLIEGNNFFDFGFGTVGAKTITLSFWVKSSLTGTFGGNLSNNGGSSGFSGYPFSYTINSANTWEYKTVTIAGNTTGTWAGATTSVGAYLWFWVGVGSSSSGTANVWGSALGVTGAVSVVGTNAATWQITGVQLEAGSTATEFERRPIGTELALCQRYYEVYYQDTGLVYPVAAYYNSTNYFSYWAFKVEKRAQATAAKVGGTWATNTPTIYSGISSITFTCTGLFNLQATAGQKCLEANAEL
jgi:hypothetical protein